VTIVTTVTTETAPFAPISPALNGFCWVNGFLFVRPTFPPAAVHPITEAAPLLFWKNFLPAPTHPAGCPSFYTLLLFVRVFAGLVYGGPVFPGCYFKWCYSNGFILCGYFSPASVEWLHSRRPGPPPPLRFQLVVVNELI
jgi:hypothetical protein